MYDDNSRNFELSDRANASNMANTDINMESVDENCEKIDRKEDEKEASPQVTPRKYDAFVRSIVRRSSQERGSISLIIFFRRFRFLRSAQTEDR